MKQENIFDSMLFSSQGVSVSQIVLLFLVGLVPIAMMSMTSYLKVSIILAVLRNALGGGQIPTQAISGVLALIITFFTMAPVLESCMLSFSKYELATDQKASKKQSSFENTLSQMRSGVEPLVMFLKQNTSLEERAHFFYLDEKRSRGAKNVSVKGEGEEGEEGAKVSEISEVELFRCSDMKGEPLRACIDSNERVASLILSFVMSELRTAFTMGIYLFLPFLVIDLIISTVLTGLGMMMVSPVTISLPVKLLLFVVTDGWRILTESLILGYVLPV